MMILNVKSCGVVHAVRWGESACLCGRVRVGRLRVRLVEEEVGRTILTTFVTMLSVFALYFVGGEVLNTFALVLILGFLFGTYSTVYIVSPLFLMWHGNKKW